MKTLDVLGKVLWSFRGSKAIKISSTTLVRRPHFLGASLSLLSYCRPQNLFQSYFYINFEPNFILRFKSRLHLNCLAHLYPLILSFYYFVNCFNLFLFVINIIILYFYFILFIYLMLFSLSSLLSLPLSSHPTHSTNFPYPFPSIPLDLRDSNLFTPCPHSFIFHPTSYSTCVVFSFIHICFCALWWFDCYSTSISIFESLLETFRRESRSMV